MTEPERTKEPFDKPALTIDEHVILLQQRGLETPDPDRVSHYLSFISYFRLSGYCRYYYADPSANEPIFKPGTSFDDVLNLYIFDRQLRNLLMDALERIEVAIKASISNTVSLKAGPFWLVDAANFDARSHEIIMNLVTDVIGGNPESHQHQFISHYYTAYSEPEYPPGWMLMEVFSFAAASKIYQRLRGPFRVAIAGQFKQHHDMIGSWLHSLSFARNVCAHHSRVWNRRFTIKPKIPHKYSPYWPSESRATVYSVCAIIHALMGVISDGSGWSRRLYELLEKRPDVPLISLGFPEDWASNKYWELEE